MKPFYLILLAGFILSTGCKSDPKKSNQNSPEAIFVQWQKLVDTGDFQKAKTLSTPSTILWLKDVAEIEADDSNPMNDEFADIQNIVCDINNDTASCTYQIVEDEEILNISIQLVKIDGAWLVDVHDDDNDDFIDD